jgi:hypothetical protein
MIKVLVHKGTNEKPDDGTSEAVKLLSVLIRCMVIRLKRTITDPRSVARKKSLISGNFSQEIGRILLKGPFWQIRHAMQRVRRKQLRIPAHQRIVAVLL